MKKILLCIFFGVFFFCNLALAGEQWALESFGRVRSTVQFFDNKVGGTKLAWYDMTTDAFLGVQAKRELANDWTTKGTLEFDLQSADASIYPQYMYITLDNPTLALNIGRQETSGVTLGGDYIENIYYHLKTGETVGTGDYFKATIKAADLTFVTGRHSKNDVISPGTPAFDESVVALYYDSKIAGTYPLAFSVASIHEAPSKRAVANKAAKAHGDERYIGYSLSAGFPFEKMTFSFNYDNKNQKHISNTSTPNKRESTSVLGYDLHLPWLTKGAGFSLMYSAKETRGTSPHAVKDSGIDLGLLYPYQGINLFLAYATTYTRDVDHNVDDKKVLYGAGAAFHFGK